MVIDDKTYKTDNYINKTTDKTQIVLSSSLRSDSNHLIRLQHKTMGRSKAYPAFTVTRNGLIYQHFDSKYTSDFIGIPETDEMVINVVLENMGYLYNVDGAYVNHLNEVCSEDRVVKKKWLDFEFWEKYDDKQINALLKLCHFLCEKHDIEKRIIDFHHFNKNIWKFHGITLLSNHIEYSTNNNPTLDIGLIASKLS